jgi:hypothetical protein
MRVPAGVGLVVSVSVSVALDQAGTGNGPAVAAVLRNTAIGYHRSNGETNIARATRRADHRPNNLIHALISSDPTTQ